MLFMSAANLLAPHTLLNGSLIRFPSLNALLSSLTTEHKGQQDLLNTLLNLEKQAPLELRLSTSRDGRSRSYTVSEGRLDYQGKSFSIVFRARHTSTLGIQLETITIKEDNGDFNGDALQLKRDSCTELQKLFASIEKKLPAAMDRFKDRMQLLHAVPAALDFQI